MATAMTETRFGGFFYARRGKKQKNPAQQRN